MTYFWFFTQAIFKERDEERERLRRELQRSQEQVHALLSQSAASHRASSGNLSAAANLSSDDQKESAANQAATSSQDSRPVSYISIEESSGPEMSEKNPESEDDGKIFVWIFANQSNIEFYELQSNFNK